MVCVVHHLSNVAIVDDDEVSGEEVLPECIAIFGEYIMNHGQPSRHTALTSHIDQLV